MSKVDFRCATCGLTFEFGLVAAIHQIESGHAVVGPWTFQKTEGAENNTSTGDEFGQRGNQDHDAKR